MAAHSLHISLSAEPVFNIGGFELTNSVISSVIVSAVIISFAILVHANLKKEGRPNGLQNFAEMIIESLYGLVHSVTQDKQKTKLFFPLIATFFIFIMLNNYSGLIPGMGTIGIFEGEAHHQQFVPLFRAATADVNTTMALALISVAMTQVYGFKYLKFKYFKKYIDISFPKINPINTFVGILEIISEIAKVLSFTFRLFGNIFAGEILLAAIAFIAGNLLFFAPIPLYGLELFVGLIQAFVFAILSLVFFNMATHSHDDH